MERELELVRDLVRELVPELKPELVLVPELVPKLEPTLKRSQRPSLPTIFTRQPRDTTLCPQTPPAD